MFHMRPGWLGRPVYRFDPDDFVEVGDYVLVTVRQSARMKESDARVDTTIWHVWRLGDGKVLEAWTFDVKEEALSAVGL